MTDLTTNDPNNSLVLHYALRWLDVELVVFDYVVVIVHPLLQHVVVGCQMCIHKHHTRSVHIHPDADGPLVAPNAAQSSPRVLGFYSTHMQQVFSANKHNQQ